MIRYLIGNLLYDSLVRKDNFPLLQFLDNIRLKFLNSKNYVICLLILGIIIVPAQAQKVYTVTSIEIINGSNESSFTSLFLNSYPGAKLTSSNDRFTLLFNVGKYIHYDACDHVGFYSGLAIRNVGMITDETLPQTVSLRNQIVSYNNYNIVKRYYLLGIPLAIKLDWFKKHEYVYFYAGGEYELILNCKEKYWTETFHRSGPKIKSNTWFGTQTPTFLPSVFAGYRFFCGVNMKVTYYLTNFLNNGFTVTNNSQEGSIYNISDLSRYGKAQVFFLTLSMQFNDADLVKKGKLNIR